MLYTATLIGDDQLVLYTATLIGDDHLVLYTATLIGDDHLVLYTATLIGDDHLVLYTATLIGDDHLVFSIALLFFLGSFVNVYGEEVCVCVCEGGRVGRGHKISLHHEVDPSGSLRFL